MRKFFYFATSLVLAMAMLTAPDMGAQTRGSSSGSSGATRSGSTTSSRSSSGSTRSSSGSVSSGATRSSGSSVQQDNSRSSSASSRSSAGATRSSSSSSAGATRSSSSVSSSSSSSSSSAGATRSSSAVQQDNSRNSGATRSSSAAASNVTRSGLTSSAATSTRANSGDKQPEAYRDNGGNYRYQNDVHVDDSHNLNRVPPRQRDVMNWDRAGHFWNDVPHYYGYRIHSLPHHWRRISHWGIDYYYCDGIYYRAFGSTYVICRPPFGTPLDRAIDRAILRSLRFAYYCDTYRTYSRTFDYYNVIARQNLIIAQQNARLIAQNNAYALNSKRALTAYELAEMLGLVQSYASIGAEYFYQDGVFYTISASGQYTTIVPPAGALVTSLPDDYEIIVMNGIEYYMVDNTVYRTTVFEGEPFLEVLGQMYGSLYNQYNIYR